MSSSSSEEKTEKPTPKKLKDSRKEGQVARTPELGAWAAILVVASALNWLAGKGMGQVQALLERTLVQTERPDTEVALALLGEAFRLMLLLSLAIGVLVMVIGVAAAVAQGGFFVATKSIKPKKSRLSLIQGGKRLFGTQFGESPVPVGLVVSPDGKRAYVAATQADVVVVVDPMTLEVVDLIKAGEEPDGMAWAE